MRLNEYLRNADDGVALYFNQTHKSCQESIVELKFRISMIVKEELINIFMLLSNRK